MTEAEWLAATNPSPMLVFIQGTASDRKQRLFAVACCRRFECLPDEETATAVELAELYSDGLASKGAVHDARHRVYLLSSRTAPDKRYITAYHVCETHAPVETLRVMNDLIIGKAQLAYNSGGIPEERWYDVLESTRKDEEDFLARLLHDMFGNPFRPITLNPSWLTSTVLALANGIYSEKAFDRMPILADALQDADCDDEDLLNHCRQPREHVKGCWVVDLLLGKS